MHVEQLMIVYETRRHLIYFLIVTHGSLILILLSIKSMRVRRVAIHVISFRSIMTKTNIQ